MPKIPTNGQWDFTYTAIPNYFLDQIAHTLKESELRVILYVYRHTLGFHKLNDCISYEQFMHGITTQAGQRLDHGAKVSRRALVPALAALEEKGLISRTHKGYRAVITISLPPNTLAATVAQAKAAPNREIEQTLPQAQVQDSPGEPPNQVQDSPPTKELSPTKNKNQKRAADLQELVTHASEYLMQEIAGLSTKEARRLAFLAIEQNRRDFTYVKQLVEYVTNSQAIRVPAAVLTTLIRTNQERLISSSTEPSLPTRGKSTRFKASDSPAISAECSLPKAMFPVEEYPHLWQQICQQAIERWDLNPSLLTDGQLRPGTTSEEIHLALPVGDATVRIRLSQALEEAIGGDYHYRLVWS